MDFLFSQSIFYSWNIQKNLIWSNKVINYFISLLFKSSLPNIFQQTASWVGKKTGFTNVYNGLANALFILLALIFLLVFSFIWKWIIKPIFRNFFGSSNNNVPQQPQPKPQPKYTDYEEINEEKVVEALPPQPKQIRENRRLEPVEKKNKKRKKKRLLLANH